MSNLVLVREALPDARIDFRYATDNNITGQALYPPDSDMLIHRRLVAPLRQTIGWLGQQGLYLVLWDANRKAEVQGKLRAFCSDSKYVLEDSNHVRDRAVDATLADSTGNYLNMGTDFDDFTPRAHRDCRTLTPEQYINRGILDKYMSAAGFSGWPTEWWHYDYLH